MRLKYIFILLSYFIIKINSECTNSFGKNHLNGTCLLPNECKGASFIGNCRNKKLCCVSEKKLISHSNNLISKELFLNLVGNTIRNEWLYDYFSESMQLAEINTDYKAASYMSQIIDETNNLTNFESIIPEYDKDISIGNDEYDDGSIYRGRGAIYLRGKLNYRLASEITNKNLFEEPEYAVFPSLAFKIAAWIAKKNDLDKLADGTFFNFAMFTNTITPSWLSLKDRTNYNELILKKLNNTNFKRGNGIECIIKNGLKKNTGVAVPMCLSNISYLYCGCMSKYDIRSCPYDVNKNNECRNSPIIKCCAETCSSSLDLAILVDTTFDKDNLDVVNIFLKEFLIELPISKNETKVSIISFSQKVNVLTSFSNGFSLDVLNNAIDQLTKTEETDKFTHKAIQSAYVEVFNEQNGMRPLEENVPKVVLLITNDYDSSSEKTLKEAINLKQLGISLITVNIGKTKITNLASSFRNEFNFVNINEFFEKASTIRLAVCYQPALVVFKENSQVSLRENEYKFYKHLFVNEFENEITIEIKEINGLVELFYSFESENPLDPMDNLFPRCVSKSKEDLKIYHIKRLDPSKDTLYFSIKGKYDTNNQFYLNFHSNIPRRENLMLKAASLISDSSSSNILYKPNLFILFLLAVYSFIFK